MREFAFRDRVLPLWVQMLVGIFSVSAALFWLSIFVLALFFIDLAVLNGDKNLILTFAAVGLILLACAFVLDVAHERALLGLNAQRKRLMLKFGATVAVLMGLFLTLVHPALSIGFFLGAAINLLSPALQRFVPAWFETAAVDQQNAVAMFAGRDNPGVELQLDGRNTLPAVIRTLTQFSQGLAVLVTIAVASWLSVQGVVTMGGVFAATLMSFWGVQTIATLSIHVMAQPHLAKLEPVDYTPEPPQVREDIFDDEIEVAEEKGLVVEALSAKNATSRDIVIGRTSFKVGAGQVLGITGESGGGKTLLLQSLMGQTSDKDMLLKGAVIFDGNPLWRQEFSGFGLPAVFVPEKPVLLPGTPVENLLCFDRQKSENDALLALQKLDVFGVQAARILKRDNAMLLSATEAQLLSLSRAFYLNPGLYVLDMPEANLTPALIGTLISQINVEKNAGRSFVIATRNRNLLEICDDILLMEDGYVADRGPGAEVLTRQASGWTRLCVPRQPDSEDRLHSWTRAQFNRKGDERNRRNACLLISELLALSCQDAPAPDAQVIFDFRHFKGCCQIAMQDETAPLSSAAIQAAQKRAAGNSAMSPKHPLANIVNLTTELVQDFKNLDGENSRKIRIKMKTYDPRTLMRVAEDANDGS